MSVGLLGLILLEQFLRNVIFKRLTWKAEQPVGRSMQVLHVGSAEVSSTEEKGLETNSSVHTLRNAVRTGPRVPAVVSPFPTG